MKWLHNIGSEHTMDKFNFDRTMTILPWTACFKADLEHRIFWIHWTTTTLERRCCPHWIYSPKETPGLALSDRLLSHKTRWHAKSAYTAYNRRLDPKQILQNSQSYAYSRRRCRVAIDVCLFVSSNSFKSNVCLFSWTTVHNPNGICDT